MIEKPHKQLDCWKKSIELVEKVYALTNTFPQDEKFGLVSQLRRATVSIPTNIAEGAERKSDKEFLNFLSIAMGSIAEVDTLTTIATRLKFMDGATAAALEHELETISKLTFGLFRKIKLKVASQ